MEPELEAAQRVGTTLCHTWTLERLLGISSMAAVYVGVHTIGRRDAIKLFFSDVVKAPELRARFEQEAHAIKRFKHPGAVAILDIERTAEGRPFLVMELLQGALLSELARRPTGVALSELLRFIDELLEVLIAAHTQGMLHRNLKPGNLFIETSGRLKVLDFGLAWVREEASTERVGTAPYMSPEQARGMDIDPRADLFSVGATMFQVLARCHDVHRTPTEWDLVTTMTREQAPSLTSLLPEALRDVGLVVDRALMFDRTLRYPDAATMQGDVRALRVGAPPPYAHARLLEGTPAPSAIRGPRLLLRMVHASETARAETSEATSATSQGALPSVGSPLLADPAKDPSCEVSSPAPLPRSGALDEAPTPISGAPIRMASLDRTLSSPGSERVVTVHLHDHAALAEPEPSFSRSFRGSTRSHPPPSAGVDGHRTRASSVPVVEPSWHNESAEVSLALLMLVGVVFAALGIGLTLLFMGRERGAVPPGAAEPSAPTQEEPPEPWPRSLQRAPSRSPAPSSRAGQPARGTPLQPLAPASTGNVTGHPR